MRAEPLNSSVYEDLERTGLQQLNQKIVELVELELENEFGGK